MDIGEQLRHAREARGLSIDALSKSIRVQPRILSAIEQNDCATIPPRPYGRGFVRTFAMEVGLDPESTVREFFSQFAGVTRGPVSLHPRILDIPYQPDYGRWLRPVGAILGYAAIAAVVIAGGRWIIGQHQRACHGWDSCWNHWSRGHRAGISPGDRTHPGPSAAATGQRGQYCARGNPARVGHRRRRWRTNRLPNPATGGTRHARGYTRREHPDG